MAGYSLYKDLKKLIITIEKNLKSNVTLDGLSMEVNISKFHLSRIFTKVAGMSLMAYIRNRKLSASIHELLNTHLKIIDIAQEYGFEFEQTYIRSFVRAFGLSPNRFRKLKPSVVIQEVLSLDHLREIGANGIAIHPPIVLYPELLLAGVRHKIYQNNDAQFHEGNAKGNEFFNTFRKKISNAVNPHVYFGLVENIPGEPDCNFYTPSVQVLSGAGIPQGMVCHKLPTQKYAVFKYIGLHHAMHTHINNLLDTLRYIYGEWLPVSGYAPAVPYHFERIDERITRQDYCEVEIYVPVAPQ